MKIQMYIPFSTLGKYLKQGGELIWEERSLRTELSRGQ